MTVHQGDFNCGASSQADFILNYFLSKFLKFLLKFSISSQPSWQAGTIKVTLAQLIVLSAFYFSAFLSSLDIIAASIFVDILVELTNTVSEAKIQITLLREGALYTPSPIQHCLTPASWSHSLSLTFIFDLHSVHSDLAPLPPSSIAHRSDTVSKELFCDPRSHR